MNAKIFKFAVKSLLTVDKESFNLSEIDNVKTAKQWFLNDKEGFVNNPYFESDIYSWFTATVPYHIVNHLSLMSGCFSLVSVEGVDIFRNVYMPSYDFYGDSGKADFLFHCIYSDYFQGIVVDCYFTYSSVLMSSEENNIFDNRNCWISKSYGETYSFINNSPVNA